MALSKAIKAALDAWKEGKGEFPDALDAGVHFDNDGAYLASLEPKAKKREQAAREAATAELLEKLGITDPAEIETIKAKIDASGAAATEADKLKLSAEKTAKELAKSQKANADLVGKLQGLAKRDALMPYANRVRDPEALSMFVTPHLDVSEDGTVTGKDGKSIEDIVTGVLTAKDYLKNPDFKAGPGTKPGVTKVQGPFQPNGDGKLSIGQAMVNELAAAGKIAAPSAGGGP